MDMGKKARVMCESMYLKKKEAACFWWLAGSVADDLLQFPLRKSVRVVNPGQPVKLADLVQICLGRALSTSAQILS